MGTPLILPPALSEKPCDVFLTRISMYFCHRLILISTLIIATSCAQFPMGRTFLSEMEHDDSRMFTPYEDFPVVAGDSGRFWSSDAERRERTPASEYEMANERSQRSLEQELRELEDGQSEHAAYLYQQNKRHLSSTSERIYFLKLPHSERMDYLESRGFLTPPESPYLNAQSSYVSRQADVILGMSKEDVLSSMGKPLKVEIAGNPSFENERWAYTYNGATKYIYFESGRVEGWE